jgi:ERF superfamily protein
MSETSQGIAPQVPVLLAIRRSETIGKLIGALAKAHKGFKPILKTSKNPFFKSKYADLAEQVEATKDALSDNELVVIQGPAYSVNGAGMAEVTTMLAHSSGEWIEQTLGLPVSKNDAQGVGSAITYARRYSRGAILDTASELDDDAESAVGRSPKVSQETDEDFDQRTEGQRTITSNQVIEISNAIKETGKTEEMVKAALEFIKTDRLENVLRQDYPKLLKWASGPTKTSAKEKATKAVEAVGGKVVAASILKPADEQKAMKRLFALANELQIPETDVKRFAYEKFGVDSMTKLSASQLDETTTWIKEVAENIG